MEDYVIFLNLLDGDFSYIYKTDATNQDRTVLVLPQ